MENPGKIGHKTHHEDKRKKQRKNYDIFYLHDSNFNVFFSLKYDAFRRHWRSSNVAVTLVL